MKYEQAKAAVSYGKKKVLILLLLDALSHYGGSRRGAYATDNIK